MTNRLLRASLFCLTLAGCGRTDLDHGPLGAPLGMIRPAHFCPGDSLVAEYEVFEPEACIPLPGHEHDCDAVPPPTVLFRARPADFADTTITAQRGHVTFAPSSDAVDVAFVLDPDPYGAHYPSEHRDGSGHHEVIQVLHGHTANARKLTGTVDVDLEHPLRCDNGRPSYAYAVVDYPDGYSFAMQPRRVCNLSAVPIEATLYAETGNNPTPTLRLAPGACADTNSPAFYLYSTISLSVHSLAIDPSATCSPLQGGSFPPIKTRVSLGCPP